MATRKNTSSPAVDDTFEIDLTDLEEVDLSQLADVDMRTVPGSVANRAAIRQLQSGDGEVGPDGRIRSTRTATEKPSIVGSIARGVGDMVTGPLHYGEDIAKRAGLVPQPDDGFVDRITRNFPPVASVRTGYEMGKDVVHSTVERGKKIADPKRPMSKKAGDVLALAGAIPSYGATLGVADMADNIETADDPVRAATSTALTAGLSTKGGQRVLARGVEGAATILPEVTYQSPLMQKFGRRSVNKYIGKESVGNFNQNAGRGAGQAGIIAATDEGFLAKTQATIEEVRAKKDMLMNSPAANTVLVDMREPIAKVFGNKPLTVRANAAVNNAWDSFAQTVIDDLARETNGTFQMTPSQADAFKYHIGAEFERTFTQADQRLQSKGQELYSRVDRVIETALPNYQALDAHLADLHQLEKGLTASIKENEWRRGFIEEPRSIIPGQQTMRKDVGTRQGFMPLAARTGLAALTHPPVRASVAPLMDFGRAALGAGEAADQWSMNVTTGEKPTPAPILPQSTPQIGPITGPEYVPGTMVYPQLSRRALPPADAWYGDPPAFMQVDGQMVPETPPVAPGGAQGPFAVHPDGVVVPEGYQYRPGFRTEPSVASPFEAGFKQEPSIVPGRNLQESQTAPTGGRPTADAAAAAEARARSRERTIAQSDRAVKERRTDATFTAGGDKAVTARKESVANAVSRRNYRRASDVAASENVSTDPIVNSVAPREVVKKTTPTSTSTSTSTPTDTAKTVVPERPVATESTGKIAPQEVKTNTATTKTETETVVPTRAATASTKKTEPQVRTRTEHVVEPDRRTSGGTDSAPETWKDGETITDTTTGKSGKFKKVVEFGYGAEARTFIKLDDGTMVPLANARRGIINSGK